MNNRLSPSGFLIDAIAFAGVTGMAVYLEWTARDLLWSLWISSLSIGYLTILAGFSGNALRGRLPDMPAGGEAGEEKAHTPPAAVLAVFFLIPVAGIFGLSRVTLAFAALAAVSVAATIFKHASEGHKPVEENSPARFLLNLAINFPAGIFMIIFFTVHFGGFHFVHSIFLNGFFPLIDEQPFGKTPTETALMFSDLITVSLKNYWFFVIASAASSFGGLIGSLRGGQHDFMLEPYKNVIRMHLMIFVIAFSGAAGLHQYVLYATLFLYFFPVSEMIKYLRSSTSA